MSHIPDKQCTSGIQVQNTLSAYLIFFPLILAGIVSDLWSKKAIFDWLQPQPEQTFSIIDGFIRLVRAENAGAAFGIAYGQRYLLIAVSVIALIIIFAVFFFSKTSTKLVHISLALLAAGVCGNLYDRIFNGGWVRDFIDIVYWPDKHWPAFNIADSMLCVGVGLLIISSFFTDWPSRIHAQQQK
jgi:signal peptidase II